MTINSPDIQHIEHAAPPRVTTDAIFEWSVTASAAALVVGLYLDGWAHIRGLPEDFFTPWHAIIYGAVTAASLILGYGWLAGRRRGRAVREALPAGYGLSLLGVGVFFLTGLADFAWHGLFGIESNIEALYSPPHLLLAFGGALIVTGPLRAAWKRAPSTRTSRWRAIFAVTFLLALIAFFTAELHPFVHPWASVRFQPHDLDPAALGLPSLPAGGLGPRALTATLGIGAFVIQSAILTGLVLLLIRRWGATLPFGWLTTLLGLTTAGLSILHWTPWTIPVALASGFAGDLLYRWLKPTFSTPRNLRWLSVLIPTILFSVYFVAMFVQGGAWWAPHLWVGALALSAITALLMSYLVVPPTIPVGE